LTRDGQDTRVLTIVNPEQLRRILKRLWDSNEFLSDYGLRSLSKAHETQPFEFGGRRVHYEPGEADTKIKGGNSNWRGPVWLPTNYSLIQSLEKYYRFLGDSYRVTMPGEAEQTLTLAQVSNLIAERLVAIYRRDGAGKAAGVSIRQSVPDRCPMAGSFAVLRIFPWRHGSGSGRGTSNRLDCIAGQFSAAQISSRRAGILERTSGGGGPARARCLIAKRCHE